MSPAANNYSSKILLFFAFILAIASFSSVRANNNVSLNLAVKAVSQKLQTDLSLKRADVRVGDVEYQAVAHNEISVKGNGIVVNADNMPVRFDVVVNTAKNTAAVIDYSYSVEFEASLSAGTEDFLNRNIIQKITQDMQTKEVVLAIGDVDVTTNADGKTLYTGFGDIRIGMDWKRIEFAVEGMPNGTATVKYQVQ